MATSAVASGARSMLRAASSRGRFASQAKSVPPMFRATARRSSLLSPLRNPVEMSFCMESMLPYHTATASALMTSMLSTSAHSYAWLSHGIFPESTHILCLTNPLFLDNCFRIGFLDSFFTFSLCELSNIHAV